MSLLAPLRLPVAITPAATSVVASMEEDEPPSPRTGPVLAASLPFPVMDEAARPAVSPAGAQFDINIRDIVGQTDRIREEAADIMPTHASQVLTVDFETQESRRDEVAPPQSQAVATQYFNIADDEDESDDDMDEEVVAQYFEQHLKDVQDLSELVLDMSVQERDEGVAPQSAATSTAAAPETTEVEEPDAPMSPSPDYGETMFMYSDV